MKTKVMIIVLMAVSIFSLSLAASNSVRNTEEEKEVYCVSDDMREVANSQEPVRGPHW
jgi:thioredoxin-related protein